jgi:hypothetical protein
VSSNPAHCDVYSIQYYVVKWVGDLWQVGGRCSAFSTLYLFQACLKLCQQDIILDACGCYKKTNEEFVRAKLNSSLNPCRTAQGKFSGFVFRVAFHQYVYTIFEIKSESWKVEPIYVY